MPPWTTLPSLSTWPRPLIELLARLMGEARVGMLLYEEPHRPRLVNAAAHELMARNDLGPRLREVARRMAQAALTNLHDERPAVRYVDDIRVDVRLLSPVGASFRPPALVRLDDRPDRLPPMGEIQQRHDLTARQAEVALLLARRMSSKEIARELGIRPNTARRHAQAVLRRLGLHSRNDVRDVLLSS